MPSDATLKPAGAGFARPDTLEAVFGIEFGEMFDSGLSQINALMTWWHPGEKSYVRELCMRNGARPGYAKIVIPQTPGVRWEAGNSLAFRADSYLYKVLKRGTLCNVFRRTRTGLRIPEWCGVVASNAHERDVQSEGLIVTANDMRDEIQDIKIAGRWQINPLDSEIYSQPLPSGAEYVQSEPAHFNPGGRPNCILTSYGIPVFTPSPDFAIADNGQAADPANEAAAQRSACNWTLGLILRYLRYWYTPGSYGASQWKWLYRTPQTLEWPETFGLEVDDEARINFDAAVGQTNFGRGGVRKGREIRLEGMYLLDALEMLLYTAGGWGLGYEPHFEEDAA